jgi:hypothetical protein
MGKRRKYVRKPDAFVTAVKLDLDTDGFTFRKWGGEQRCKAGDWLVENQGDTYTVDAEVFDRTYALVSPGVYRKITPVWAEEAEAPGTVDTMEGTTDYAAGDFIVSNHEDGADSWAITAEMFRKLYEPAED